MRVQQPQGGSDEVGIDSNQLCQADVYSDLFLGSSIDCLAYVSLAKPAVETRSKLAGQQRQRKVAFGPTQHFGNRIGAALGKIALGCGAGVQKDQRRSSMIVWENGLPLIFRGLNGLKGPGWAARTSFPSATTAALTSSRAGAEFRWVCS